MELREDQIEAVLRFDGAVLKVVKNDDLLSNAGQTYTAIIYISARYPHCIARADDSRTQAVRNAWEVYQRYKATPPEEQENGFWLYEQAVSKVTQIMATKKSEKQNG